jgi:hypothetical protein
MKKENLKIVKTLLEELNTNNILYCHWKSNQHFNDALTGIYDIYGWSNSIWNKQISE